jgi:3-dehydroquinate synthase
MGAAGAIVSAISDSEVTVELGARSYPVVVGSDLLGTLGTRLAALGFGGRCGLVTTTRVAALYREPVVRALKTAGLDPAIVELPDGEEHKNLASLAVIYDRLIEAGLDRQSVVVALGGGVIGDLAGFAAATLFRGVAVAQVPTTLLAQVDAAIGGKTGVNHARGKNLIGAFHQPRLVLADVGTLRTLPRREFLAGLAEIIKYGVIGDAALFAEIEARLPAILAHDEAVLAGVVSACAGQKAAVVAADEREESGVRARLNFGHTVGHAVEALTEYRQLLHGEAVAIGMVAAARISQGMASCDHATVTRIERLLERAGLPTAVPAGLTPQALALAMQTDKKSTAGRIRFVAVEAIGRVRTVELTASEIASRL